MADRVIANSSAVRNWLVSLGMDQNHIDVIPNGIAVKERLTGSRDSGIRHELGIDPKVPVIAAISRLNPGKGIEYLLKAAVIVRDQFPEARFLIVGGSYFDPAYKPSLERLAKELNVADRVLFTGERNDIQQLLQEVNISVLPSLSEGLSNSLLESMAAGLPVIATNVGGNPEIVQDGKTGFLVPARDEKALSDAILRMLKAPEMGERFGDAGYQRVSKHFSLAATVRRTEDLYTMLLEQRMWRQARLVQV